MLDTEFLLFYLAILGNLLQFVCLCYVLFRFWLHGIYSLLVALSEVRAAACLHDVSSNDGGLCEFNLFDKLFVTDQFV